MAACADPFEYTATGLLGYKRDAMLENELLLRCELGRPMRRGYVQYPGVDCRYGKPNVIKDGGAGQALSGWPGSGLYFHRKKDGSNDIQPKRDFMALNKSAVQAGLTTSSQYYQFRASHDIRRKVQTDGETNKSARRILPSMVFGIATRPSTPIHDLLEHKYQDRWLQDRRNMEQQKQQKHDSKKLSHGEVYGTRASLLRVHQVPVDSAPLWQLPKFTKSANPHLESFRTDKEKRRAFNNQRSDGIARQGTVGQGIHEPAKN